MENTPPGYARNPIDTSGTEWFSYWNLAMRLQLRLGQLNIPSIPNAHPPPHAPRLPALFDAVVLFLRE